MKNIISLILISCLIFSCKKDSTTDQTPGPTNQSDNILYHSFSPNISLHSILSFVYNPDPLSCGNTPVPTDSSIDYNLNLNADSVNDFVIMVRTTSSTGGSIHCANETYTISINAINADDSINFTSTPGVYPVPIQYDTTSNNVINQTGSWQNQIGTLSLTGQGVNLPFNLHFTDSYIGIKIKNNFGWIHIAPDSLNGIIIKDYAINLTEYNSIKAGQKN